MEQHEARMTIFMDGRCLAQEAVSLMVVTALITGPISVFEEHYLVAEKKFQFSGDYQVLQKIQMVLETRSWNDPEFQENRDNPLIDEQIREIEAWGTGTYEQWMTFFLSKVDRIVITKLVPRATGE